MKGVLVHLIRAYVELIDKLHAFLTLSGIWRQGMQLYHRYILNRKLVGPYNQSEHSEEEKSL
jgi:hypothetical protein